MLQHFLPLKRAWRAVLPSLGGVGGGFLLACSGSLYTHEAAREAAEKHYSKLIKGDYRGFVKGYAFSEEWPEDFRSQIVDVTAQFMARDDMRSLMEVKAISDSLGDDSTAYVMLQLQFSDSTSEQIELPLILMEEGWKMQ